MNVKFAAAVAGGGDSTTKSSGNRGAQSPGHPLGKSMGTRRHLKDRSQERYNISTNRKLVRAINRLMDEHGCKHRKNPQGVTRIASNLYELKDNKSKYLVKVLNPNDYKHYWFLIGYTDGKLVTFLTFRSAFWFAAGLPDDVNKEIWHQYQEMGDQDV